MAELNSKSSFAYKHFRPISAKMILSFIAEVVAIPISSAFLTSEPSRATAVPLQHTEQSEGQCHPGNHVTERRCGKQQQNEEEVDSEAYPSHCLGSFALTAVQ